jgi:hypothetical protein
VDIRSYANTAILCGNRSDPLDIRGVGIFFTIIGICATGKFDDER